MIKDVIWKKNYVISLSSVKQHISIPDISYENKIILLLGADPLKIKTVKNIRELGIECGLTEFKQKNLSYPLSCLKKGFAIRVTAGWELSDSGRAHLNKMMGGPVVAVSSSLREYLEKITKIETKNFVEEAVQCFEAKLYRAAVVLSWVGAISVLHDHVFNNHLRKFNEKAKLNNPNWKDAKCTDDFTRMKESVFLVVCESASVYGRDVKKELEAALDFRNSCGHPNSLITGEHRVSGHIETLILNVYSKFL